MVRGQTDRCAIGLGPRRQCGRDEEVVIIELKKAALELFDGDGLWSALTRGH